MPRSRVKKMGTDRWTEYRKVNWEGVFSYLSRQLISEWQGWGNEAQIASAMGIWSNTRTGPQNPEEWQWVTREAEGRSSQKRVYAEDKVGDWAQTDWDHCWPWWRVEISRFFFILFWVEVGREMEKCVSSSRTLVSKGRRNWLGMLGLQWCVIYHNILSRSKSCILISGIWGSAEGKYFYNNWFETISVLSAVLNFSWNWNR